ncbi:MAG: hypothetical protein DRQ47_08170 [Gammaproteobacteria bacterium]|nr:MAG: hypothetical protein DRQ47_08170 [Gammaproteobacteria bacterium]
MVEFLKWSDDYLIGDIQIDTHHKLFFDMVKDISRFLENDSADVNLAAIVDFLHQYVEMHFRVEEEIMMEIAYPDVDKHKDIHKGFSNQIAQLREQLESQENTPTLDDIFTITQNWFLQHILTEDKQLTKYL